MRIYTGAARIICLYVTTSGHNPNILTYPAHQRLTFRPSSGPRDGRRLPCVALRGGTSPHRTRFPTLLRVVAHERIPEVPGVVLERLGVHLVAYGVEELDGNASVARRTIDPAPFVLAPCPATPYHSVSHS